MKIFTKTDELFNEIINDKETRIISATRYPVRFIFIPNFNFFKEVIKRFDNLGINKIELAEFLPHNDGWFTVDDIKTIFDNLRDETAHLIIPLSEIARFLNDDEFVSLFNTLSEIENSSNSELPRRFYIPLLGIYERFQKQFLEKFHRKNEWAPIWQIDIPQKEKIKVSFTELDIPKELNIHIIPNTKEWLSLYKMDELNKVIITSKTLLYNYKNILPDQVFDIKEIKNIKEFFIYFYGIDLPILYKKEEDIFWRKLLKIFNESPFNDFYEMVKEQLNVTDIDYDNFILLWISNDDPFKRWLIKEYILTNERFKNSYLYLVINSMKSSFKDDELLNGLWFTIFELKEKNQMFHKERIKLLKKFYILKEESLSTDIEKKLDSLINKIEDKKERIHILTGISKTEKRLILEMLKNEEITPDKLKYVYKELYYYLLDLPIDNIDRERIWITEYLKDYKLSKIENSLSANLKKIIKDRLEPKEQFNSWYHLIESNDKVIVKNDIENVILIDYLGIEWISMVINLLEDQELKVENVYITKPNLSTNANKNNRLNITYINDLKELYHNDNYQHLNRILNEIEIISDIIRKKIDLSNYDKIAISSTNGLTYLPKIDKDFFNFGTPFIEEILVPLFIISKYKESKEEYNVIPQETAIKRNKPFLYLDISPKPKRVKLFSKDEKEFLMEYDPKSDRWFCNLKELEQGKNVIDIVIGKWKREMLIEIISGLKERELI